MILVIIQAPVVQPRHVPSQPTSFACNALRLDGGRPESLHGFVHAKVTSSFFNCFVEYVVLLQEYCSKMDTA